MKTVTLSNRFYYRELDKEDAQAIKNDFVLFKKMFHKAYKYLTLRFQGIPWDFESLQKEIKKIDKKLKKLIEKTKQGKQTQKDYLKEVQELRPKRNALKNQISQLTEALKSRCRKEKISIKEVEPAYTSRIAKDKYMKPMGAVSIWPLRM